MILQQFGNFTGHIDLALVALYLFWAFFFWLVLYLQQEGRREGFPLVGELDDKPYEQDLWMPSPKTFTTNDGRVIQAPDPARADTRPHNLEMVMGGVGSPFVPTGNPMTDAVGPGSYAERPDVPDYTFEMKPRLVPMRADADFDVAAQDVDPRGKPIMGCDDQQAGVITDIWVDRSDFVIRYLEVEIPAGMASDGVTPLVRSVLVPWNMVDYTTNRDRLLPFYSVEKQDIEATFKVKSITAAQFADVPALQSDSQITLLEEEKVMGYFGGGYLYATKERQEPWL